MYHFSMHPVLLAEINLLFIQILVFKIYLFPSRLRVAASVWVEYHSSMVQFCAKVIAPGMQASAKLRRPKKSSSRTLCLAPLAQGATLSILGITSTLRTLSQLTGLGQPGAGGEGAARAVGGEAPEQGLASALYLQLGANHVTDQHLKERPASKHFA